MYKISIKLIIIKDGRAVIGGSVGCLTKKIIRPKIKFKIEAKKMRTRIFLNILLTKYSSIMFDKACKTGAIKAIKIHDIG